MQFPPKMPLFELFEQPQLAAVKSLIVFASMFYLCSIVCMVACFCLHEMEKFLRETFALKYAASML